MQKYTASAKQESDLGHADSHRFGGTHVAQSK